MLYKRLFTLFVFFLSLSFPYVLNAQIKVIQLDIDGAIGPATQDYIEEGIDYAHAKEASFVLLKMNTPGGFDTATRNIVKTIIASPLPIVTYVAPEGSRAASAGTYILYASHIAAMAPATHLGAATPIPIDPFAMGEQPEKTPQVKTTTEKKALSDSLAYIKGLAQLRGRNVEWAEKMVSASESLQSNEALRFGVIDILALNRSDLFKQIDGRTVTVQSQPHVIKAQDVQVEPYERDWRLKFLEVITDPSIAYILLIIGMWGLFFEFVNPGFIFPGVTGAISLLVALYAFQLLPIDYTGLALIIIGIIFMAAEVFVTSYGILGIGGLVAFVVGSILLFDQKEYAPPWAIIIGMSATSLAFFLVILSLVFRAQRRKVVSGKEALPSTHAIVQEAFKEHGWVRVEGELWKAKTKTPVHAGEKVRIIKCDGLELTIKPLKMKGKNHV